ncbi:MAG: hypothetical protein ACMXYF_00540 [Candidatus Woesearchaeota archaeon]
MVKSVREQVLEQIKPKEDVLKIVETVVSLLKKACNADVRVGGSIAKQTYLANDYDCDIFVRYGSDDKDLSELLEADLKKTPFSFQRVHGSRDYFQTVYQGVAFEFIPVKHITKPEQAQNVTDMSVFHVDWISPKLNDTLRDDIRLLKQFCKAQRVYGAESYIGGFSGHILDILVIYYGGFEAVLQASKTWKQGGTIDIEKHMAKNFNADKLHSPLIIVDPVDPSRNAATGLANDCFSRFQKHANAYLQNPSVDFFVKTPLSELAPKSLCYFFQFTPVPGKVDVSGAKVKKAIEFVLKNISEFGPHDFLWDYQEKTGFFSVKTPLLSKTKTVQGPPLNKTQHVEAFVAQHEQTYEQDGRVFATVKRDFFRIEDALEYFCQSTYVKERVVSLTWQKAQNRNEST